MPTAIATIAERIVPHNELYCITAADIIEPAIDMIEQMILKNKANYGIDM